MKWCPWLPLTLLVACGKDLPAPPDADDTAATDTTTDDTAADDTAADDTGGPDSATGGDTDTGEPEESCGVVTFTGQDGVPVDLTQTFTDGDPHSLTEDGTLTFCAGDWFVRLTVEARVEVFGLGRGPASTVLSGGEAGTVVLVRGAEASVSLENVTLDRGAALGVGNQRAGGGLRCEEGAAVSVRAAVFSNNVAYDGGALAATPGCDVTVEDTTFADNVSEDDAGAVRLDGLTATFRDVRFERNVARDCGALFINEADVLIEGAWFEGNVSTDTQGGAVLHYYGELTVRDATFVANDANGYGGAMTLFGDATLEDVTFTDNTTTEGGAIYTWTAYGELTCAGCSFTGNSPDDVATDLGGSYTFGADADFTCDAGGCD